MTVNSNDIDPIFGALCFVRIQVHPLCCPVAEIIPCPRIWKRLALVTTPFIIVIADPRQQRQTPGVNKHSIQPLAM
jgi:hypothetical protein